MKLPRRTFLTTALAAGRVFGANERVRIAGIGVGGRCRGLLQKLPGIAGTELAAIADVYEPRFASFPAVKTHGDYRAVLDDRSIDAVVIGSPDHWHVRMTLDALSAGKDVYVEKPLTKTVEEGDAMLKAYASTKQVVQVGYQQRTTDTFQKAKELIEAGELGEITFARTYWYQNYLARRGKLPAVDAGKLNWKGWLGGAPDQPFDALRYTQWRWFWDFGGGTLTDLFSHWIDSVHWLLGDSKPSVVSATGAKLQLQEWDCPDTVSGSWRYPKFVVSYDSTLVGGIEDGGVILRGSKGMMKVNRAVTILYPEEGAKWDALPKPSFEFRTQSDGTQTHIANWVDCIRSRKTPNSNIRDAVAAARAAHWGNQSMREERTIRPSG